MVMGQLLGVLGLVVVGMVIMAPSGRSAPEAPDELPPDQLVRCPSGQTAGLEGGEHVAEHPAGQVGEAPDGPEGLHGAPIRSS